MTALRGDINARTTLIQVDAPIANPVYPFFRDIDDETVKVVGGADTTEWQVERGVGDSQQTRHAKNVALVANSSPFGGTVQSVLSVTTVLTNAQIKALPTTAVELVPAPASGIAVPLMAFVTCDHAAGAYTNINATFSYITVVHGDDAIEPMTLITNSDGDGGNRVVSLFLSQLLALGDPGSVMLVNNGGSNINAPQGVTTSGHFYETELWAGALSLYAYNSGSGNFTGGNAANSLTVTVLYTVVE